MNLVESVQIDGLWFESKLSFDVNHDVTFLIGENGTGKTTIINLIAAALSADFDHLDRIPFEKIKIKLAASIGRKKPEVEVRKDKQENLPFPVIQYKIKNSASEAPSTYSLDEYQSQMRLHRGWSSSRFPGNRARTAHRTLRRRLKTEAASEHRSLYDHLRSLALVNWLSVHRSDSDAASEIEYSYDSSVDRKLNELNDRLVRYFSQLGKRGSELVASFQKHVFLTLLIDEEMAAKLFQFDLEDRQAVDKERQQLVDIFEQFNIPEHEYESRVKYHFDKYLNALNKLHKGKEEGPSSEDGPSSEEVGALMLNGRIHSIVSKWEEIKKKEQQVYEPRETFLSLVNGMFKRKSLSIGDNNELIASTHKGSAIDLKYLSSGEKQLLIILGEALLQEKKPYIYIADEPELSLHVNWQSVLIQNILSINPNAQVLVATHSPDIVGPFGDRTVQMDKFFSDQK